MKFLHAADIHLDSPLAGIAKRADIPPQLVADCTRRAFANLIDLAIAEDVAFLVIAGDLYDGAWKDHATGLFFAQQMRRLARPCFLIRGNHDAYSEITRRLELPPNVREFSSQHAETFHLDDRGVALHGRSFPRRAVPEDLSATYPDLIPGLLNIGVLHTSAENPGVHETYAPCTIASLQAKGYDYWALGHIHDRRALSGAPPIIFPGNLQGRHPNETGAKGATLVHVEAGQIVAHEHRVLDVLRWVASDTDLDGVETMSDVAGCVGDTLAAIVAEADGRPAIVRLTLTGTTALHAALIADPDAIAAECRNAAIALGAELYLEQVRVRTRPIAQDDDSADTLALLRAAFAAALDDPVVSARLVAEFATLAGQIPHGTRPHEASVPRDADALRALLPDAWQTVLHALRTDPIG